MLFVLINILLTLLNIAIYIKTESPFSLLAAGVCFAMAMVCLYLERTNL